MSFVNLTAIIAKIIDKKIAANYYYKTKILLCTTRKKRERY